MFFVLLKAYRRRVDRHPAPFTQFANGGRAGIRLRDRDATRFGPLRASIGGSARITAAPSNWGAVEGLDQACSVPSAEAACECVKFIWTSDRSSISPN